MTDPKHHPAFEFIRRQPIDAIQVTVEEYRHRKTGARHYHIASDQKNNVFLVGLRTVPMDSTGVAHILEHTVLCGSERYPVRDPFFMMIRRSLNTFMNAFTSSDWTAYPFASQNRKDFFNLLDVYLDAVFFSRLDELDFCQEGHRVEFEKIDDPESPLVFKGVVFNEMKGAMSSPVSVLWQALSEHLFPTTTYHYNSGGDPEAIPDLTHEQLVGFYKRFYHPSNAVFMTFGDIPAETLQAQFEEKALARFERIDPDSAVPDERRYDAPVVVEEAYALDEEDTTAKTHVVLGWLLGRSNDLDEALAAQLLTGVLLENSSSPLLHALETTDLGSAPSPMCGLEDDQHELLFAAGVEGSEPEHAEAVEKLVLEVIGKVAEEGVAPEVVETVLHQIELSQREITGDRFPYGLQLIMQALPAAIHDGDPIALLDLEPALARLRERAADPDFIKGLARSLLLDNPHRVRLTLKPDTELSARKLEREQERLARMKAGLDDEQKRQIIERAHKLLERQAEMGDVEILPTVTRADIPDTLSVPEPVRQDAAPVPVTWFDGSTNGLVYEQLALDLPDLSEQELDLLPLYSGLLTEVGCGGRDYIETAEVVAARTGGFSAYRSIRPSLEDEQTLRAFFMVSGKALVRNQDALATLLHETLETARFDETDRIADLVAQMRFRSEQGVAHAGHQLAMSLAASRLSPRAALSHRFGGVLGVRAIKQLDEAIRAPDTLDKLSADLSALHERIVSAARRYNIVAEGRHFDPIRDGLEEHLKAGAPVAPLSRPKTRETTREAWIGNLAVHYCAKAFPAVPPAHEDAAALSVLGGFLRNGFLHRAIREQGGAYGGGASYDGESASFRFFSYRDPRMTETLADFDRAVDWMLSEAHEQRSVDEAIFGVVSAIDRPGSPAGEAKKAFVDGLHGRTPGRLRALRSAVLEVTLDDLRRVTESYLVPERASIGVLTGQTGQEEAESLGLKIERI
ncbi:MAG: insulinase family protein [Halothiobacillaceae bacterium]